MSEEPQFAGQVRWALRWEHPWELALRDGVPGKVRVMQKAVPIDRGPLRDASLEWQDVPEVDET